MFTRLKFLKMHCISLFAINSLAACHVTVFNSFMLMPLAVKRLRYFVEPVNLLDDMKVLNFIMKPLIHISGTCREKTYYPILQVGKQPQTSCLVKKLRKTAQILNRIIDIIKCVVGQGLPYGG